jgi:hypothetical protein
MHYRCCATWLRVIEQQHRCHIVIPYHYYYFPSSNFNCIPIYMNVECKNHSHTTNLSHYYLGVCR